MTLFCDSTSSFPSSLASLAPAFPFPIDHHSLLSTCLWEAVQVGRTQQSGLWVEREGEAFALVEKRGLRICRTLERLVDSFSWSVTVPAKI